MNDAIRARVGYPRSLWRHRQNAGVLRCAQNDNRWGRTVGGGGQSVGAKPHLKSEMGAQLLGFAGWPLSSWTGAKGQGGFGSLLDLGAGYGVG
jgi:hypothetical protein